jgi:hypothetical protein
MAKTVKPSNLQNARDATVMHDKPYMDVVQNC